MNSVVLPYKPGDDLWIVDEDFGKITCEKGGIKGVVVLENGQFMILSSDEYIFPAGEDGIFTSKEDAEEYMKKFRKN